MILHRGGPLDGSEETMKQCLTVEIIQFNLF